MANDRSNPWGKARPKATEPHSSEDTPAKPERRPGPGPGKKAPQARERQADSDNRRRPSKAPRSGQADSPQQWTTAPRNSRPNRRQEEHPPRERRRSEPAQDTRAFQAAEEQYPAVDRSNEYKVYGVNACMTAFQKRPEDIIRAYFNHSIAGKFGETMRYLAQQKKAYRVVDDEELEKVTASTHHGGVCFLMKKRPPLSLDELLAKTADRQSLCLLILEGVGNPHNLGAILRTCAHFDVPAVLVENANLLQSGAAARVAEGGAEWVETVQYDSIEELLNQLRQAGFSILSTSSHQGRDLYRTELPSRMAIFFGEEARGLKTDTLKATDLCVQIPGSSQVESLNVSTATGIILGEFWRQHQSGTRTVELAAAKPRPGRLKLHKPKR